MVSTWQKDDRYYIFRCKNGDRIYEKIKFPKELSSKDNFDIPVEVVDDFYHFCAWRITPFHFGGMFDLLNIMCYFDIDDDEVKKIAREMYGFHLKNKRNWFTIKDKFAQSLNLKRIQGFTALIDILFMEKVIDVKNQIPLSDQRIVALFGENNESNERSSRKRKENDRGFDNERRGGGNYDGSRHFSKKYRGNDFF